jgi:hypothetical protein
MYFKMFRRKKTIIKLFVVIIAKRNLSSDFLLFRVLFCLVPKGLRVDNPINSLVVLDSIIVLIFSLFIIHIVYSAIEILSFWVLEVVLDIIDILIGISIISHPFVHPDLLEWGSEILMIDGAGDLVEQCDDKWEW